MTDAPSPRASRKNLPRDATNPSFAPSAEKALSDACAGKNTARGLAGRGLVSVVERLSWVMPARPRPLRKIAQIPMR